MPYVVIRAVRLEGFSFSTDTVAGQWLESYNPDANDGWGDAVFTNELANAKRFVSIGDAFAELKRQPSVRPLRPDGQPNRPLTAFTVTLEEHQ